MAASLLTAANWPIVGQICWLLGKVMNFIYTMLDNILPADTGLVGLSIIIYTIVVYTCMLPMTINQQKTTKLQAVISPEVQKIQKKYRGKRDQASQLKMQEEVQQVYDKYGASMMGGCLPMLIQMPFLFALYPVIYDIQNYVPEITKEANKFLTIPSMSVSPAAMISGVRSGQDFVFPAAVVVITAVLIPVLSGLTQYLSIRLSQHISGQKDMDKDNPMAGTMKTMNVTMPLFSVFMVFSFPSGIGVYWIVSAIVRCVQQVVINKSLSEISVEDLIEKNREKAKAKQEKRGQRSERLQAMAQTNTKSLKNSAQRGSALSEKEREEKIAKAKANAKAGSMAAKANMVKNFNENK